MNPIFSLSLRALTNPLLLRAGAVALGVGGVATCLNLIGCASPDSFLPSQNFGCNYEGEKNNCTFSLRPFGNSSATIEKLIFQPNFDGTEKSSKFIFLKNPDLKWKIYPNLCKFEKLNEDGTPKNHTFSPPLADNFPNTLISTSDKKAQFLYDNYPNSPFFSCDSLQDESYLLNPNTGSLSAYNLSEISSYVEKTLSLNPTNSVVISSEPPFTGKSGKASIPFHVFENSQQNNLIHTGIVEVDLQTKSYKILYSSNQSFDLTDYFYIYPPSFSVENNHLIVPIAILKSSDHYPEILHLTVLNAQNNQLIASIKFPSEPILYPNDKTIEGNDFSSFKEYFSRREAYHLSPDGKELWLLHHPALYPDAIPKDLRASIHPQSAAATMIRYDLSNNPQGVEKLRKRIPIFSPIDFQFIEGQEKVVILGATKTINDNTQDMRYGWYLPLNSEISLMILNQSLENLQTVPLIQGNPIQTYLDFFERGNSNYKNGLELVFNSFNFKKFYINAESKQVIATYDQTYTYAYENGTYKLIKTNPHFYTQADVTRTYDFVESTPPFSEERRFFSTYMSRAWGLKFGSSSYNSNLGLQMMFGENKEVAIIDHFSSQVFLSQLPESEDPTHIRSRPCFDFANYRLGSTWARESSCRIDFGGSTFYQDQMGIMHLLVLYGNDALDAPLPFLSKREKTNEN